MSLYPIAVFLHCFVASHCLAEPEIVAARIVAENYPTYFRNPELQLFHLIVNSFRRWNFC